MTLISGNPAVIRVRSIAYAVLANLTMFCFALLYPLIAAPRPVLWAVVSVFIRVQLWLLKWVCGLRYDLQGIENLPPGPCILASRHEAMWEAIFLPYALGNPAVILKAEILRYPLAGPVARKLGYIGVDRSGDLEAARRAFGQARQVAEEGRSVLIFPNGTRDPRHRYRVQPGVSVLYRSLKLPCVPIILNSGDHWILGSWLRRPGTITVQILPPIPAGLPIKEFTARLTNDLAQPAGSTEATSVSDSPSVANPSNRGI